MGRSSSLVRRVTTDESGKALMQNLYTRGRGCQVKVVAPNMITQSITVTPGSRENPAEEKIQLTRGGTIRGVVVDPEGNRVPNVRVYYNDGHRGFNETGGVTNADDKGRSKSPVCLRTQRSPSTHPGDLRRWKGGQSLLQQKKSRK